MWGEQRRKRTLCVVLLFQFVLGGQSLIKPSTSSGNEGLLQQRGESQIESTAFEDPFKEREKTWCDDVLGCLYINESWYGPTRPFNPLPDTRESVNTKFYLNTRSQPDVNQHHIISADNFLRTTFDLTKPTKFVVHGYTDTGDRSWVKDMASDLLVYGDYNVIRVDWKDGARPLYTKATANTRVVGLEIEYFLNQLITDADLDPSTVHCIGHSLGSHVCGYGGEGVPGLGRITGLDPAGPYFTGTPYFVHLDPTDASFVDVIHTDSSSIFHLGFGTYELMGNLDFFPNSGYEQPGCDPLKASANGILDDLRGPIEEVVVCQHIRAIKFFLESLKENPSCSWLAHTCESYESFEKGLCFSCGNDGSQCAYMGIRADEYVAKSREFVSLYLDTDKDDPYCMNHYDVSLLTADPPQASSYVVGRLYISLYGDDGTVLKKIKISENHEKIYHGKTSRYLFLSHTLIENIDRIELEWIYSSKFFDPGTYCFGIFCNRNLYVQSVEVSPISIYPESNRLAHSTLFCGPKGSMSKINDGHTNSFESNGQCEPITPA